MVVAEQTLPIPEDLGSNPVISLFCRTFVHYELLNRYDPFINKVTNLVKWLWEEA